MRFHFHVTQRSRRLCHGSGGQSPACLRGAGSKPMSVNVGSVVGKVALGQVFKCIGVHFLVSFHPCSISF